MIKKISQLNLLPLSAYSKAAEEYWSDKDRRKFQEMLFEVSYLTANKYDPREADEIDYYNSYSIELSALDEAFRLPDLRDSVSTIVSGGLSVVRSDFEIGTPGNLTSDETDNYRPGSTNLTIYSALDQENDSKFHGTSEFHNDVLLRGQNHILSVDSSAHFSQLIHGVAYRAQWGDLAEYYSADAQYEPGTLVKFGGENEITIATEKANAVVTSKPGVVLNGENGLVNPTAIALAGRVPVKVRGEVKKFDKIVLSRTDPGIGVVYNFAPENEVIGRALEDNQEKEEKLVLCATRFNIG